MTKELLSEVLKQDVKFIGGITDNMLLYCGHDNKIGTGIDYFINIHELAHKCKEWAYSLNYGLESKYSTSDGGKWVCLINEYNIKYHSSIHTNTEPETIFKACEWILKQKGK